MAEENELDAIRRRRLEQLQRQQQATVDDIQQRQAAAEEGARQEQAREQVMRQILTPEARERLERLRMARPEEARQLENQLIQLAQSGRLQAKIDDEQLKLILNRISPGPRDINIRRK
jgi:programmed cell death protein 5